MNPSAPHHPQTELPEQILAPVRRPSSSPLRRGAKLLLALAVGMPLGYLAMLFWQSPQQAQPPQASASAMAPSSTAAQALAAVLQAKLVIQGREHAIDQNRIALPTGTHFSLRLHSNVAGKLSVYTISPTGQASDGPIWTTPVSAGQTIDSPSMHLEQAKGLETLQLRLQPANAGPALVRELQLWHL